MKRKYGKWHHQKAKQVAVLSRQAVEVCISVECMCKTMQTVANLFRHILHDLFLLHFVLFAPNIFFVFIHSSNMHV